MNPSVNYLFAENEDPPSGAGYNSPRYDSLRTIILDESELRSLSRATIFSDAAETSSLTKATSIRWR